MHPVDRVSFLIDTERVMGWMPRLRASFEAQGLFWTLLPHTAFGPLPTDQVELAVLVDVPVALVRRIWPEVAPFFEERGGALYVRENDWLLKVRVEPDRKPLRHLLDRLVAFWGRRCVYCKASDVPLEVEHVVPIVRGGSNDLNNLTVACVPCNRSKGTRTAAEFGFPRVHLKARRQR